MSSFFDVKLDNSAKRPNLSCIDSFRDGAVGMKCRVAVREGKNAATP
jgi:hypothetical protein